VFVPQYKGYTHQKSVIYLIFVLVMTAVLENKGICLKLCKEIGKKERARLYFKLSMLQCNYAFK